jgi:hypothetical protein
MLYKINSHPQTLVIPIKGEIFVPEKYKGRQEIIIPDEVVHYCIDYFDLAKPGKKGLDPMAGVGTIPRIINAAGGDCLGIELAKEQYEAAIRANHGENILHGDFLEVAADIPTGSIDYIMYSPPFVWYKNEESIEKIDPRFFREFKRVLNPKTGYVLLDTLPFVERDKSKYKLAKRQAEHFAQSGFNFIDVLAFDTAVHIDESSTSLIMQFEPSKP